MTSSSGQDWRQFWETKAQSDTDFQATGRGGMDVVGFLYTVHEVVKVLALTPSDQVVDIGCGTGLLSLAIAPWVKDVQGIDISENMVTRAQGNLGGVANAAFAVGNALDTGLRPSCADKILGYSVLQYLGDEQDLKSAFAEAWRVLKPGGRALFAANPDPERRPRLEAVVVEQLGKEKAAGELALMDEALWMAPHRYVELANEVGFKAAALPINERIWQHFYMFDLLLEKPD